MKTFADVKKDMTEFMTLSSKGRKHCGERRTCHQQAFSPFPTCFQSPISQACKTPTFFGQWSTIKK